tara:strand:- start:81 stop:542 length:462 start_codon:yes stop_codon:yes gene_type:complete
MKNKLIAFALAGSICTPAFADSVAKVRDVYIDIEQSTPLQERRCRKVEVPVYERQQTEGDAAGGALLGMILGGVIGKGVTGDDGGAAAGAVMGGLIGADKGSKQGKNVIVGYKESTHCDYVTTWKTSTVTEYSHSEVTFKTDGKVYTLRFLKD